MDAEERVVKLVVPCDDDNICQPVVGDPRPERAVEKTMVEGGSEEGAVSGSEVVPSELVFPSWKRQLAEQERLLFKMAFLFLLLGVVLSVAGFYGVLVIWAI